MKRLACVAAAVLSLAVLHCASEEKASVKISRIDVFYVDWMLETYAATTCNQ